MTAAFPAAGITVTQPNLSADGAECLGPPVECRWQIRAFLGDPDGHRFETSERLRDHAPAGDGGP